MELSRQEKDLLGIEEYDICSKLLGWPDIIPNNMTSECELISRGFYLGNGWKGIPEKDVKEREVTSIEDWRLLF